MTRPTDELHDDWVAAKLTRHTPPTRRAPEWGAVTARKTMPPWWRQPKVRWIGLATATAATVMVLIALPKTTGPSSETAPAPIVSNQPPTTLSGGGMQLELPGGWFGRFTLSEGPGAQPELTAANFPLPDDLSAASIDELRSQLGGDQIVVRVRRGIGAEIAGSVEIREPPLQMTSADLLRDGSGIAPAYAGGLTTRIEGDLYSAGISFGTPSPDEDLIAQANAVLATLTVNPGASLPDGRHFGYIRWIGRRPNGEYYGVFDIAEFLTGAEGEAAARADGVIGAGESLFNDYYVRNPDNEGERSGSVLIVDPAVAITRFDCSAACRDGLPGELAALAASFGREENSSLATPYRGSRSQYWVTLTNGRIAAIDEQYVP